MTCQTCGSPTSASPALCRDCMHERAEHGRAKARHRAKVMAIRLRDKSEDMEAAS